MANSERGSQKVSEFMTRDPQCVTREDSIMDAAKIMRDADTGVVPVVDGKKIVGLVTDRDIVVRGIAGGKNVSSAKISDVMSEQVRSVREDTPVSEVLEMMGKSQIRRVPVVNQSHEIVGIVSIGDLATSGGDDKKIGQAVQDISDAPPNN